MTRKLKGAKAKAVAKATKLYCKTPKVVKALNGTIHSIHRHADKQLITIGDKLLNTFKDEHIVFIGNDTRFIGDMYVKTNLGCSIAVSAIVLKPNFKIG